MNSMKNYCDLQTHSTFSDGTATPTEIVKQAAEMGLYAIAITDHDTVSGQSEAREAGRNFNITIVPGVEISCEDQGRSIDLLGYGFDADAKLLDAQLSQLQQKRRDRNQVIIQKLNDCGLDITYAEVEAEASKSDGQVIGRPHFATVMLKKNFVATRQQAFDEYLAESGCAFVPKMVLSAADAIHLIHESNGVAVLAHPALIKFKGDDNIDSLLTRFVDAGLDGLECYYSLHSEEEIAGYLTKAEHYGLLATGGSDYHGGNKPEISLGTGLGNLRVPADCARAVLGL